MILRKMCYLCKKWQRVGDFAPDKEAYDELASECTPCLIKIAEDKAEKAENKTTYPREEIEEDIEEEDVEEINTKSIAKKSRKVSERTQWVIMMDSNTGEGLREFRSASIAAESFNKSPASIRSNLRGATQTAHGYKWKYK